MNSIIKEDGTYLSTTFTDTTGAIWRLHGTATGAIYKALDSIDTFTDGKGLYKDIPRYAVYDAAEKGRIKAT